MLPSLVALAQSVALLTIFNAETSRAGIEKHSETWWHLYYQIKVESAWNPIAQSRYAMGLAQFTPPTAKWIFPKVGCNPVEDLFDPSCQVRAQTWYMKWLLQRYAGREDPLAFAEAGYNGGAGWIDKELVRCRLLPWCRSNQWWEHVEKVCIRAPWACEENRGYPRKIRNLRLGVKKWWK